VANPRHVLGREAERSVARWLEAHGWQVIEERHRSAAGEIDLLALDAGHCLVAVEVRFRSSARAGSALESVSPRHLRRVRTTLTAYARRSTIPHRGVRVDLVAVSPGPHSGTWRLVRVPGVDAW
jgi:putative endonuclease